MVGVLRRGRGRGRDGGHAEVVAEATNEIDAEVVADATNEIDAEVVGAGRQVVELSAATGDVPNPDRGFYTFIDDLTTLTAEDVADLGVTLVYTPIRLDAYRDGDIDDTELALLSQGMDVLRDAGLGLILRFTYNYPDNEQDYLDAQDAPLDRVRAHIAALTPVIAAHADIITFWQAGFIGAWGEWHSSSNGLTTPALKVAVRDALLAALPAETFLQFRYPPDLAAWLPTAPTEAEFASAPAFRVGFHNDCFMSSDSDVGTFEDGLDDPLRAYVADLGAVAPFGGETCDADDGGGARLGCEHILAEGARYHLSYLNRDYFTAFHDRWDAEGCLDEVTRRMGYRLELASVELPTTARPGEQLTLRLMIDNTGWARPFVKRMLVVYFGDIAVMTSLDVRRLIPGRATHEVTVAAPLVAGRYDVALAWPDAHRPVRFAIEARGAQRYVGERLVARGRRRRPVTHLATASSAARTDDDSAG